jgi:hypothetical protein
LQQQFFRLQTACEAFISTSEGRAERQAEQERNVQKSLEEWKGDKVQFWAQLRESVEQWKDESERCVKISPGVGIILSGTAEMGIVLLLPLGPEWALFNIKGN